MKLVAEGLETTTVGDSYKNYCNRDIYHRFQQTEGRKIRKTSKKIDSRHLGMQYITFPN
jgi:hypothetical protein